MSPQAPLLKSRPWRHPGTPAARFKPIPPRWGRPFAQARSGERTALDKLGSNGDAAQDSLYLLEPIERDLATWVAEGAALDLDVPRVASPDGVRSVTECARDQDLPGLIQALAPIIREGASFDSVLFGVLAPAARRLGACWTRDEMSFSQVTAGMGSLSHAVHLLSSAYPRAQEDQQGYVLLSSQPGDQHSFGLTLLGAFLENEGFHVDISPGLSLREISELIESNELTGIGFSVSDDARVAQFLDYWHEVQPYLPPGGLPVFVGGPAHLRPLAALEGIQVSLDAREVLAGFRENMTKHT